MNSLRTLCSMAECFPEKSSWCRNEQVYILSVKRFEHSNELDTALYKNITLPFYIVDIDECEVYAKKGTRLCIGICQNTPGSFTCTCPEGYLMLSDGKTCQGK